jgi:hypothetical protein
MSSFYVGQRVRIRASGPRHGCEATLISFDLSLHEKYGFGCYWHALVDGWGCRDPRDGVAFAYQESDLEPIIQPGLESLEDINALYETEPCEADV